MTAVPLARVGSGCAPARGAAARTRTEVVALGQRGSPWAFVPVAEGVLAQRPEDEQVRALLAGAYCRLGLRTAALEHLERIVAGRALVKGVHDAAEQLAEDRIAVEARVGRARAGAAALAARGVDVGASLAAWEARTAGEEWFACTDGNIVRRRAVVGGGAWLRFADEVSAAKAVTAGSGGQGGAAGGKAAPTYIEGMDPPWLLLRLAAERARSADGYWARLVVIVEDPLEALDGLACADLVEVAAEQRLEVIVGPGAAAALAERLRGRLETELGTTLLTLGTGTRCAGGVGAQATLTAAILDQERVAATTTVRAQERYAGRDAAWWARRFARAGRDGEPALRVLIPTTRYSTYVQHASRDIAAALEAAGCTARVVIEPDDSSVLVRWAQAKAVEEFEPDLIVLINYPRRHLEGAVPAEVPFVCWIQDSMAHLFDGSVGASQGALDFVAGHLHASLFETFGYRKDRALGLPVLASRRKFHTGPVSAEARARFACEVACVTHHSQTAEELWRAMAAGAAQRGGAECPESRALRALWGGVQAISERVMEETLSSQVRRAAIGALEAAGQEASPERLARLETQAAWPLLDRLLRHQTLEWAAEMARRRGWRLHLYGRGWARHATLGEFARGEVAHGEDLRACYQAAAVHLHVSPHTPVHQRVMECALSGGVALCRLTPDHVCQLGAWASSCLGAMGAEVERREGHALPLARAVDHWSGMALLAQLQRLGVTRGFHIGEHAMPAGLVPMTETARRQPWAHNAGEPVPAENAWLMGDLCETCFRDRAELESRVERAVERPAWRADIAAGMAGRVEAALTYEAAAARVLEFVARLLKEGSGA